ncbi:sensor histidine kinase [Actinoplanes sp. NPDC049668]|uniref:sensor histidine kinase n=1 Tax=unclassified Actinoplanes TaxID=2626549 RepID=UPI0033A28815
MSKPTDTNNGARPIRHLLAGAVLSTLGAALLATLVTLWGAALLSLLGGPDGGWGLFALYLGAVSALPLVFSWFVHEIGVLHRARFRRLLGADIPEPSWTPRGVGRQLAYHLWALVVAAPATVLIMAPPVARRFARWDTRVAEDLLGPGDVELLYERMESLRTSRREVLLATDEERRRIERDLHDGAQQRLMSLALNLGMAREAITEPSPARDAIVAAHEEAMLAVTELRQFVRGLHPAVLDDRGLDAAVSGLAARSPIPVEVSVDIGRRCPGAVEAIAYFIVAEALTNVARHAGATRASIELRRRRDRLAVTVTDDGRGNAAPRAGGGLAGLAQRAAAVDGELSVTSPAGGPTVVRVVLPCG